METKEQDITAEEVMEYCEKCTANIKAAIAEDCKANGVKSLPIAWDVPSGITLTKAYLTTPNKELKNFITQVNNALIDAWGEMIRNYAKHPLTGTAVRDAISRGKVNRL